MRIEDARNGRVVVWQVDREKDGIFGRRPARPKVGDMNMEMKGESVRALSGSDSDITCNQMRHVHSS